MPYISEKINLNKIPGLDRRIKLTEADKQEIKELHKEGTAIRAIARAFPQVSRRLIQYIIFPDRLKVSNYPGKWKKYQVTKSEWAAIMREHRQHKQRLYLEGKI